MRTRLKTTLDPNLYTQVGLDSGSLTMLGTIVHQLGEAGKYRGALHHGPDVKAVFFVTADSNSPVSQATIDLSGLDKAQAAAVSGAAPAPTEKCGCDGSSSQDNSGGNNYTVNPRGYVLFHVPAGEGGYYVHLRRIDLPEADKGYDTRTLSNGDVFTAMILRPGIYSILNSLSKARLEVVVPYPKIGDKAYVPPDPVRIDCSAKGFDYKETFELGVGQGLVFNARVPSRIVIHLEKPDDGSPTTRRERSGYQKPRIV